MTTKFLTLLSLVLLLGCQATRVKQFPSGLGLEAQVGKPCMVYLADERGRDGILLKATDGWIVIRRKNESEEWIPTTSIIAVNFQQQQQAKVTRGK